MKLLVLPGDGIGPEITDATLAVCNAADARFGLGLKYDHDLIGFPALEKYKSTFPDHVRAKVAHCDGVILGPVSHLDYPPRDQGGINPSGEFRVKWDLYANIRPAKSRMGLSRGTVKNYRLAIYRKLDITTERELFLEFMAAQRGE
jgi:3-isopropylmalate dehydrogenase